MELGEGNGEVTVMSTQAKTLFGMGGGAVSIGTDQEDQQDPTPDGEELPEDDEVTDEHRDPEPTPEEDAD